MSDWSAWETIRRQVAIGGRVVDEHGGPVAGAQVAITSMPESFKPTVAAAADKGKDCQAGEERPDCVVARTDGVFFFLDLPEGRYKIRAVDERSGRAAEKSARVSIDKAQTIKLARVDFKLSG